MQRRIKGSVTHHSTRRAVYILVQILFFPNFIFWIFLFPNFIFWILFFPNFIFWIFLVPHREPDFHRVFVYFRLGFQGYVTIHAKKKVVFPVNHGIIEKKGILGFFLGDKGSHIHHVFFQKFALQFSGVQLIVVEQFFHFLVIKGNHFHFRIVFTIGNVIFFLVNKKSGGKDKIVLFLATIPWNKVARDPGDLES